MPQLLELQRVSSRLQGVLQDYHAAFDLDILEPVQFARGVVAAHPHFLNPMMLGGTLGAHGSACAAVWVITFFPFHSRSSLAVAVSH